MVNAKSKNLNIKYHGSRETAMTLMETMMAMAMIAIIFAVIAPQFKVIENSWDSKQGQAESIQNGRVLIEHLARNLSKAVQITAVSGSAVTNGFIEFEDNDGNTIRYDIDANSYVEFGQTGSLSQLAGPVTQLQFTCYDACDLDTPLSPITDVNVIRFVQVQTTLTNSASNGQDKSFTTSAYLRTNKNTCPGLDPNLIGWWKMDEASGLNAADSSGNGNYGTLNNMAGDEWTAGPKAGALEFNGNDDYVSIGDVGSGIKTIAFWMQANNLGGQTNTGFKSPSATGDDYGQWTRPEDAYISDDQEADENTLNQKQDWYDFGFVIPAGCSIDGIEVSIEARKAGDGSNGADVEISWGGGSTYTSTGYDFIASLSEQIFTLGGLGNTWGRTWAVSDFSNANFRIRLNMKGSGVAYRTYVDHIQVKVYYTQAGGTEKIVDLNGTSYIEIDISQITAVGFPGTTTIYVDGLVGTAVTNAWHHVVITDSTGIDVSAMEMARVSTDYFDGIFDDVRIYDSQLIAEDIEYVANIVRHREFTEAKRSADDTSLTISTPAGTSEDDLLIAAVITDASETISPPGGQDWTLIDHGTGAGQVTLGVWWKLAQASESPSHQFTWSSSEQSYGFIMRFTGHNTTNPINDSSAIGGSNISYPPSPAVTTTVPDCLILRIGGFDDDDVVIGSTGLSGHTDITMDESNTGSGTCSGGAGYVIQQSIGSSGTSSFLPTTLEQYRTVTIAIAPETQGGQSGGSCAILP